LWPDFGEICEPPQEIFHDDDVIKYKSGSVLERGALKNCKDGRIQLLNQVKYCQNLVVSNLELPPAIRLPHK